MLICTIAAPTAAADPAGCDFRTDPPPPVDSSEKPAPGQTPPTSLPVPSQPVGGSRMGECGPVLPPNAPAPPANQFESWVLADLDTGQVLAARDPHARQRPASLIKVLLSLVVMRELKMDTVVTGSWDDANQDGTRVGIGPGGQYTNDQLFHALLMHSGNDCAHAFAAQLGGADQTVAKMNTLAHSVGALDTRTATPAGLDGPGMVSSAYDLALMFRLAMQDKRFAAAVSTEQIPFPGWGGKPGFQVDNDNPLLYNYDGDLGGKTGYTAPRGRTTWTPSRPTASRPRSNSSPPGPTARNSRRSTSWDSPVWLDELYQLTALIPDVNTLRVTHLNTEVDRKDGNNKDKTKAVAKWTIKGKLLNKSNPTKALDQLVANFREEGFYSPEAPKVEGDTFSLVVTVERRGPSDYSAVIPEEKPKSSTKGKAGEAEKATGTSKAKAGEADKGKTTPKTKTKGKRRDDGE